MQPDASIIIPHYGELEPLLACLDSILNCTDLSHTEVIIVSNNPRPIDLETQRRHPSFRFAHEPTQGAAHARNAGVALSRAPILFFTDSDCTLDPAALTHMLALAPKHDIIGGAVLATLPDRNLSAAEAFEAVFAFDQASYIHKMRFSVTACLITHRRVFDAVGGFKPNVSEDLDWCHRAADLEFKITYEPSISVHHPCRSTWSELSAKWVRLTAQTYALNRRNRTLWIVKACAMPLSIIAHIPRVLGSTRLPKRRDKAIAIGMLARLRLWRMVQMLKVSFQSRA